MNIPTFRYHPDPLATGSIVVSEVICRSCERARGYIYAGPVYAREDLDEEICPWCIADGSAASQFEANFVVPDAIGDFGRWASVSEAVVKEISTRTPGFNGWQQERWWTHCGDGAEYLGTAGQKELMTTWSLALDRIRAESGYGPDQWASYFEDLDAQGSPTAYIFRCRHCSELGGYSDCH